jgi:PhnB protein
MAPVKPIPDGQHSVTANLIVKGGRKAIDFYKQAFSAKEIDVFTGPDGRIMHAVIQIGDSKIFLSDEMPENSVFSPLKYGASPVSLYLYVEDCDATFKKATAAGATVKMPLENMFWGDRFGKLNDPFGHEWAIATHKEEVSKPEMEKRGKQYFEQMSARSTNR